MKNVRKVPFVDAANEIMSDFLQSMPEITVDQATGANIERAYHGDVHSYIRKSYNLYLEQVVSQQGKRNG